MSFLSGVRSLASSLRGALTHSRAHGITGRRCVIALGAVGLGCVSMSGTALASQMAEPGADSEVRKSELVVAPNPSGCPFKAAALRPTGAIAAASPVGTNALGVDQVQALPGGVSRADGGACPSPPPSSAMPSQAELDALPVYSSAEVARHRTAETGIWVTHGGYVRLCSRGSARAAPFPAQVGASISNLPAPPVPHSSPLTLSPPALIRSTT